MILAGNGLRMLLATICKLVGVLDRLFVDSNCFGITTRKPLLPLLRHDFLSVHELAPDQLPTAISVLACVE